MPASSVADTAPTPAALIDAVRAMRAVADATEVEILKLAVEWAHAHPVLDEYGIEESWIVVPPLGYAPGEVDTSVECASLKWPHLGA
ncbi:hypothetical protein BH09ACT12_BH09ACT12_26470 [soil metagenome]